jgi:hypothetical protein
MIMAEVTPAAATIVSVGKDDPYPTGTPANAYTDLTRVHTPQERTAGPIGTNGNLWERQKIQNLAAHGLIAGGAQGT